MEKPKRRQLQRASVVCPDGFDRMVAVFTGLTADQQQPPWSDSRFVRMCAKDVAAGSGVPPPLSDLAASSVFPGD